MITRSIPPYNLPIYAPAFRLPPFRYNHIRRVSIVLETTPSNIKQFIPEGLEYVTNKFVVWVEHRVDENPSPSPHTFPHPFNTFEASIDIPVRFRDLEGTHIPLMWVPVSEADFGRAVAGRELQGIGKKLAHFYFDERLIDDEIVVRVSRNGVNIIDFKVELAGEPMELPTKPPMIGVKVLPKVDGTGYDLYKIVAVDNFHSKTVAAKGCKVGSFNFGVSEEDPVYKLKPTKILGGQFRIWTGEVKQPCGRELADLLKEDVEATVLARTRIKR